MIVWRSTSAIEGWANDKNVFGFQTSDGEYQYWHEEYIENFTDPAKLINAIKDSLNGTYKIDNKYVLKREEFFLNWFYKNDYNATGRLVVIVEEVINSVGVKKSQKILLPITKILYSYLIEFLVFIKKIFNGDYNKLMIRKSDLDQINSRLVQ